MVLIFYNSVLKATFPSAKHRFLGTGLARLQKVKDGKGERESERKSHCLGLWENQFALPFFVWFAVNQSHCWHRTAHP